MNFPSNTTTDDFLQWLRYAAIEGGQRTGFIDCIDALICTEDLEAHVDKLKEELEGVECERDALRDALRSLVNALHIGDSDEFRDEIEVAENVLEECK